MNQQAIKFGTVNVDKKEFCSSKHTCQVSGKLTI